MQGNLQAHQRVRVRVLWASGGIVVPTAPWIMRRKSSTVPAAGTSEDHGHHANAKQAGAWTHADEPTTSRRKAAGERHGCIFLLVAAVARLHRRRNQDRAALQDTDLSTQNRRDLSICTIPGPHTLTIASASWTEIVGNVQGGPSCLLARNRGALVARRPLCHHRLAFRRTFGRIRVPRPTQPLMPPSDPA